MLYNICEGKERCEKRNSGKKSFPRFLLETERARKPQMPEVSAVLPERREDTASHPGKNKGGGMQLKSILTVT